MTRRLAGHGPAASSEPLPCGGVCAAAANERPGAATGWARRGGLPVVPGWRSGGGRPRPARDGPRPAPCWGRCAWAKPPSGRPAAVGRDGRAQPQASTTGAAHGLGRHWPRSGLDEAEIGGDAATGKPRRRGAQARRAGAEATAAPRPNGPQGAARAGRTPARVGVGVIKRGRQDAGPTTWRLRAVGCVRRTASGVLRPARWSGQRMRTGEPGRGPRPPQADQRGT